MKKILFLLVFIWSCLLQGFLDLDIEKDFIASLLTVFSIFFGFYITSFAVFATSKYLSKLYKIEDKNDNRKTLLDVLLEEFIFATYFLLASITYLLITYIIIENKVSCSVDFFFYLLWGIISINIFYAFITVSTFIKVTRQSAKENNL